MCASVCVCVWQVTELLLADWREILAEEQEPLQASTRQPVQHKQEHERLFWALGVVFCLWGGDRLTCVFAAWAAVFGAPAGGGRGTGFLLPAAGSQTEPAHAPPLWVRSGQ